MPGTAFDPFETFMPAPADGRVAQEAVIRAGLLVMLATGSRQFVEQRLRLFQIGRVEAFGEPAVDRREKVAGFGVAALVAAEPGEARGGAQFPELGLLLLRRCSGLCDTVPRRPRNALAAAATGLCACSAPPRTSAPLSFRRSAKHRPTGSRPLQFALRSHMPWPGGRYDGASTPPPRWRGKRPNRCAGAISPPPHRHF